MNPPAAPRALVVEDDRSWQQILSEILADCGLEVDVAGSLDDAIFLLKSQPHRIAVVDLSLSTNDHNNYDGLRVLEAVRRLDPNCRSILLTGFATVELAVSVLTEYNAFTFLRKESFQRSQFRDNIYRALASAPNATPEAASADGAESAPLADAVPPPVQETKALIVEDDAGWRSILEELLIDCGFQVRLCSSFGEALGYLRREKFTLAVVDLSLTSTISSFWSGTGVPSQQLEGYQLLASTKAGGVPTIVVSGVASPEDIKRAYAEQAIFAYMEKQTFDRAAFRHVVEEAAESRRSDDELAVLTEREREVLELLAHGMTNKEIAEQLYITTNTVKRHIKAIFEKLDVHTRSAAASVYTTHAGGIAPRMDE
jgi:RNA polymerase sigma factor (sigma-70 family)